MNTVTTVNLNGTAYQIEEEGVRALRRYLEQATSRLKDDPDRDAIVADLEQAIAEKCDSCLSGKKNVVSAGEVARILDEMGPVETDPDAPKKKPSQGAEEPAKRLYRIPEQGWLTGTLAGIAAYFSIDAVALRLGFMLLTLLTAWFPGVILYIVLAVIVPEARTGEERAAARGERFNAEEIIERARRGVEYAAKESGKWWEQFAKEYNKPENREHWARATRNGVDTASVIARAVLIALLVVLWIASLWSVVVTGTVFGFVILAGSPVWALLLGVTGVFYLLFWPISSSLRLAQEVASGDPRRYIGEAVSQAIGWLLWLGAALGVAYLVLRFGYHVTGSLLEHLRGHVHIGSHQIY